MSESKHTPGPWIVDGSYTYDLVVGVGRDDDRLLACPGSGGAMSWTDRVCTMSWSGGKHDANAHLIAAAPEMYEALKACLVQAEGCWMNHYGENPEGSAEPEHIATARAVIAKAEGRS